MIEHYELELSRLGWSVRIDTKQELAAERGCGPNGRDCPMHRKLTGTRNGLCYSVMTEHYPGYVPPGSKRVYLRVGGC